MEAFYTIQGEGFHAGKAAYFIRLGGCDIGCSWCDVKESWDETLHALSSIETIVNKVKQHPSKSAVITGGEPLMYNLESLTAELHKHTIQTFIETSGAYPLSGSWDWICLSPKKFKPPLPQILQLADELKIIIFNKSDFLWAEKYAQSVSEKCKLYMQPEWSRATLMAPLIVDYVKQNPQWRISLQLHKYLKIP